MIVVPNQLYSFHYSQVPGFERIYELSQQHSYGPVGVDEFQFQNLPPEHRLYARRETLNGLPNEEAILQREFQLAQSKGDDRREIAQRDVETPANRQALERLGKYQPEEVQIRKGVLRRQQLPHRVASGYVKLDQRKERMAELIEEVSRFFGEKCHCQGDYWYPPGGFRDWHTNKYDTSGWRLYIIDVDAPAESYFRIKSPATGEIVTLWDQPGTFNFFLIDPSRLLWHCIGSQLANRWSKGFVIPDTWLDSVVARLG